MRRRRSARAARAIRNVRHVGWRLIHVDEAATGLLPRGCRQIIVCRTRCAGHPVRIGCGRPGRKAGRSRCDPALRGQTPRAPQHGPPRVESRKVAICGRSIRDDSATLVRTVPILSRGAGSPRTYRVVCGPVRAGVGYNLSRYMAIAVALCREPSCANSTGICEGGASRHRSPILCPPRTNPWRHRSAWWETGLRRVGSGKWSIDRPGKLAHRVTARRRSGDARPA